MTFSTNATSRRQLLLGASAAATLAGCDAVDIFAPAPAGDARGRAALLLPLSGRYAGLGKALASVARLGGGTLGLDAEVEVLDAGATPDTAVSAARAALDGGAQMLLGPLFSEQAAAVAKVANRKPVVALTNDETVAASGLTVFGVTPRHSAQAAWAGITAQGWQQVGLVAADGVLGQRGSAAARGLAAASSVSLGPRLSAPNESLRAYQAVYVPTSGPEAIETVAALRNTDTQVIGSAQWLGFSRSDLAKLEGAWFAAPDPVRFRPFAETAAESLAQTPGLVAGLVFDAVEMARILGRIGAQNNRGLTRKEGFAGVLGPYRIRPDGLTDRALTLLEIGPGGGLRPLGRG